MNSCLINLLLLLCLGLHCLAQGAPTREVSDEGGEREGWLLEKIEDDESQPASGPWFVFMPVCLCLLILFLSSVWRPLITGEGEVGEPSLVSHLRCSTPCPFH